jgi:hypothetical protein
MNYNKITLRDIGVYIVGDETFIGQKEDMPKRRGFAYKHAILSLVERGGTVRSFHTSAAQLVPILRDIAKEAPKTEAINACH